VPLGVPPRAVTRIVDNMTVILATVIDDILPGLYTLADSPGLLISLACD
jgi:hypothetical protein